jgi:hypothetical protein
MNLLDLLCGSYPQTLFPFFSSTLYIPHGSERAPIQAYSPGDPLSCNIHSAFCCTSGIQGNPGTFPFEQMFSSNWSLFPAQSLLSKIHTNSDSPSYLFDIRSISLKTWKFSRHKISPLWLARPHAFHGSFIQSGMIGVVSWIRLLFN